jgi:hypothetical protein
LCRLAGIKQTRLLRWQRYEKQKMRPAQLSRQWYDNFQIAKNLGGRLPVLVVVEIKGACVVLRS